jgi:hypothetical protein
MKEEVGGYMDNLKLAYCNECEDLVEYDVHDEIINEEFKGIKISYKFSVGRCKYCNCEVATDIDYNSRKSKAKIEAYKRKMGLITLKEISEILEKYDIGKEILADIAGFGKVTIKRYYDGVIPSREYSDILLKILCEEDYFMGFVEENKEKLREVAYRKIVSRYEKLAEISSSKVEQIANYIITHLGEVTPLALEKLLKYLKYNRKMLIACGDGLNDISMIEYAGVGVAMDNAIPSVKEVANFVTKSNLEDGVAFAIEKYVLN